MNKSELRKKSKEIINKLDKDYILSSSKKIAENVINSDIFKNSKVIFVYINTDNEPTTEYIINEALKLKKTVCVPKCISKSKMLAIKIDGFDCLKKGYFGIKEPENTENQIDKADIDLAIIPCVAASRKRERLGHGAGYYDRFLENTNAFKMCICFEKLVFDYIPTNEFDIIMDNVVTENEIIF